jgi:hypothetical protein
LESVWDPFDIRLRGRAALTFARLPKPFVEQGNENGARRRAGAAIMTIIRTD